MNTQGSEKETKQQILPAITLPKGGGAIQGIGEKFSVNAVTGTGGASIPIPISPGRNGFQPNLTLSYDSGAGNSGFGLGWNLSLSSISRKTSRGLPLYDDTSESDVFLMSGAEDLVPFLKPGTNEPLTRLEGDFSVHTYRPRTEGGYARIEKWVNTNDHGNTFWKVTTRENITHFFGKSAAARITDPDHESRIFQWMLEKSRDNRGNLIRYEYVRENLVGIKTAQPQEFERAKAGKCFNQLYLKTVSWCNQSPDVPEDWHFQLVLDYGEHHPDQPLPADYLSGNREWSVRPDPFSSFRAGFEIRTYRLCSRLLLFHQFPELNGGKPTLVRSTDLKYDFSPVATLLTQAWQTGYIHKEKGYRKKSTPAVCFDYSQPVIGNKIRTASEKSLENLPEGIEGRNYQFVDLEGEGIAGVLTQQGAGWYYKENEGNGRFLGMKLLRSQPSLVPNGRPAIQDIDGDGVKELVVNGEQTSGYFTRENGGWKTFRPFRERPRIDWNNPNLRMLDLTGDGFADVLITADDELYWFPSKAKDGFGPAKRLTKVTDEQQGPAWVFNDRTQTIFLADMSGDGLTDIVRVRNRDIAYWPNLGYGKFGAKITMKDAPVFAPHDRFDTTRLRLGDIDGAGTTDILYFGEGKIRFWINESGNSWSAPTSLDAFPDTDSLSDIQLTDLLGKGTPCLVWTTQLPGHRGRHLKYIDLMEGAAPALKPYLLTRVDNGMGKVNILHYAPSTEFYLADKKNGTPWITKLHFPVQVVKKVETLDEVAGARMVTSYRYRHGFYDGKEREFRGFGMVEQTDAESFEAFQTVQGQAADHDSPPILTRTWYHTGAYIDRGLISGQYFKEYYAEPGSQGASLLGESVIDAEASLNTEAKREALRALRGQMLRQEVYALDGTDRESIPYTVTESTYAIRQVQGKQGQRHGVYAVEPRESITCHYERNPQDPRVTHSLILKTGPYGTPLQTAQVAYPRRLSGPETYPEQQRTHIVLSETTVAHVDTRADYYLLSIPLQQKSFEVTGVEATSDRFTWEELKSRIREAREIPFHQPLAISHPQKRLLAWQKNIFWDENQAAPLPWGVVNWPLLAHHEESAVFTPETISEAFDNRLDSNDIQTQGYTLNEGYWWNPGLIRHFRYHDSPEPEDTRNRTNPFLFPVEVEDPFETGPGQRSRIFYDDYSLLPLSAEDPEGNQTQSQYDYRTLSPKILTDANENTSEVITDPLGRVIATFLRGTQADEQGQPVQKGDAPANLYQEQFPAYIGEVVADPHRYLQGATSYFFYDLQAWKERQEPPQYISLSRETHESELAPGEQSVVHLSLGYSDGFGRALQTKLKTESGIAFRSDGQGGILLDASGKPIKENVSDRWLSSGRKVYNNKEKPVKEYEPFYIDTWRYESERDMLKIGLTPVLHYDPMGRVVRTDTPAGHFSEVTFDPWKVESRDANDTVLESAAYAAGGGNPSNPGLEKAVAHANTPSIVLLDSLGRAFRSLETEQNGEVFVSETTFDISGNPLSQTDPRQFDLNQHRTPGEQVHNFTYLYDMAGAPLLTRSKDAGDSRIFTNILGNPVFTWSPRGHKTTVKYDSVHRPLEIWGEGGDFTEAKLLERMVYGKPNDPAHHNSRGQLVANYDQSGKNEVNQISFKGEVLQSSRKFTWIFTSGAGYTLRSDLDSPLDWNRLSDTDLERETFTSSATFNALGWVTESIAPDGTVVRPELNHSGMLKKVHVKLKGVGSWEEFVKDISYNERGQRESIRYGNDVVTEYQYERLTYRLSQLQTARNGGGWLQNLSYEYDPVGNIVQIRDEAQQTHFYNGEVVEAASDYTYSARYQLEIATGREHIGQHQAYSDFDATRSNRVHRQDGSAMRRYRQTFAYDKSGNLARIAHRVAQANPGSGLSDNWTREFRYAEDSNRLLRSGTQNFMANPSSVTGIYRYDAAGNMLNIESADAIRWNYKNELVRLERGTTMAWYQYAGGERSRKIVKKGNVIEVRYYLDGVEIFRKYDSKGLRLERETLHIMDDTQRIALVDTQTLEDGQRVNRTLRRYQLSNHLGSASIEVDEVARIISYEEFYPYGCTSYQAVDSKREVPAKRYRYTGMERDEESGLNYHSARYYAPWLGRWMKPDPAGTVDGLNLYMYVRGNPVRFVDLEGKQICPPEGCVVPDVSESLPPPKYIINPDEINSVPPEKYYSLQLGQGIPEIYWEADGTGVLNAEWETVLDLATRAKELGRLQGFADYHKGHPSNQLDTGAWCSPEQSELTRLGILRFNEDTWKFESAIIDDPEVQMLKNEGYFLYFVAGVKEGKDEASEWTTEDTLKLIQTFSLAQSTKLGRVSGSVLRGAKTLVSSLKKRVQMIGQSIRSLKNLRLTRALEEIAKRASPTRIGEFQFKMATHFGDDGVFRVTVYEIQALGERGPFALRSLLGYAEDYARKAGAKQIQIRGISIMNESLQTSLSNLSGRSFRGFSVFYNESSAAVGSGWPMTGTAELFKNL